MSVLEDLLNRDACPQCWAQEILTVEQDALEEALRGEICQQPAMLVVGLPSDEALARMARSGRREMRFVARLALLEPHECRKEAL